MVISPPPQIATVLYDFYHNRICDGVLVLDRIFVFVMEELYISDMGRVLIYTAQVGVILFL